jgi:predicted phosphohydrolase
MANPLPVIGDVLILAGDIVLFSQMEEHMDFFRFLDDHFAITFWLPGNHEYYYYDIKSKPLSFKEKAGENIFLVNNVAVDHSGARFIFSTLWSKIQPANELYIQNAMSDFHVIKDNGKPFTVPAYNRLHEECLFFIENELNKNRDAKTIVVTHHVPTYINYPEEYKENPLNEAFAIELSPMIEKTSPDYWLYGHNHTNIPGFNIGKTMLLTNQLGYVRYNEHKSFTPSMHFTL